VTKKLEVRAKKEKVLKKTLTISAGKKMLRIKTGLKKRGKRIIQKIN